MSFTVRVQNYQSIREAKITVDGFTVVTGSNNTGKSALLRAIRSLFVNSKGNSFVRYGCNSTKVTVAFPDGSYASWEKGAKVNSYNINGQVLNKVGTGVPEELEAFGVVPVTISTGADIWPQFAPQFTGQTFLLDQPGSVIAEILSDVERVSVLNKAKALAEQEVRQALSTIKLRKSDQEYVEQALSSFDGLDHCETLLAGVEATHKALQSLSAHIEWLKQKTSSLKSLHGSKLRLEMKLRLLSDIPSLDDAQAVQQSHTVLLETTKSLDNLRKFHSLKGSLTQRLSAFEVPSADPLSEIAYLQSEIAQVTKLRGLHQSAVSQAASLSQKLQSNSNFEELTSLEGMLVKARNIYTFLQERLQKKKSLSEECASLRLRLQSCDEQIGVLNEQIQSVPRCPTCGRVNEEVCL